MAINAQWGWEVTREISDLCCIPCRLMWPSLEYKFAAWQLDLYAVFCMKTMSGGDKTQGKFTRKCLKNKWLSFTHTNEVQMTKTISFKNYIWERSGIIYSFTKQTFDHRGCRGPGAVAGLWLASCHLLLCPVVILGATLHLVIWSHIKEKNNTENWFTPLWLHPRHKNPIRQLNRIIK